MIRAKPERKKKVRVNVYLEEETLNNAGQYISNLSAFINKCLKNYYEQQQIKKLKEEENEYPLCLINKRSANKKRPFPRQEEEPIDEQYKWW